MKKLLVILVSLVLLAGCAGLKAQTPTDPPQTPAVVLDPTPYIMICVDHVKTVYASPNTLASFKEGLKTDFQLDLQEMKVDVALLGTEDGGTYFIVYLQADMVMYCKDSNGLQVRAVGSSLIATGIDKETKEILGGNILDSTGISILDGWNGKNV